LSIGGGWFNIALSWVQLRDLAFEGIEMIRFIAAALASTALAGCAAQMQPAPPMVAAVAAPPPAPAAASQAPLVTTTGVPGAR